MFLNASFLGYLWALFFILLTSEHGSDTDILFCTLVPFTVLSYIFPA